MKEQIIFAAKDVSGIPQHHFFRKPFVLQDIHFELPAGYLCGIIGKNGAGKTTFFDYIMNERKCYRGQFLLEGVDIHANHPDTLNQIGFVSEKNHFLELRTARQNAEMLGRFFTEFDMELFLETMEQCNLSVGKNVGKMSRGELMKFQLAFAIAHKPKLFLMDEATAGMDPIFRIDLYKQLRKLLEQTNCSVILSTHNEEEIEKQLDYVSFLDKGRMLSFGENDTWLTANTTNPQP